MKKNEDASCLVKNNPNIIKELREVLPELQVIFDSDNDVKNTLKANIKEFAKSILWNRKEKKADKNFRVFSNEKGKHMEKKIKILIEEREVLVEEIETLSEKNKKLTAEKENLEKEKEKLKNYMRCGYSKNKLLIYYYVN